MTFQACTIDGMKMRTNLLLYIVRLNIIRAIRVVLTG